MVENKLEDDEPATDYTNMTLRRTISESAMAAATYVNERFLKVKKGAEEGHWSFRVFAFFGGVFMVVTSIFDWLHGLLNLTVIHALISFYAIIFGLIVCILEGHWFLPKSRVHWQNSIQNNANILRYVWGRGLLYFFAGSLQFSHMSFFNMVSGGFMMILGIFSVVVGRSTARKLAVLRSSISDETVLRNLFNENDTTGDGLLTSSDFGGLVKKLGLDLDKHELEAAFGTIDKDNDGKISYSDFKTWWKSFHFETTTEAQFEV